MPAKRPQPRNARLLLIGGAEDPDERNPHILPHLVQMAGGRKARLVVCSAPSAEPEEKVDTYGKLFRRLGVAEVVGAPIAQRNQADETALLEAVGRATAVFFTGGDQLRLSSLVAGTEFAELIRTRLFENGLVVAGTSAGAAAAGSVMIIGGGAGGHTVRRADVDLAPGLGYWRDSVVDTHFNQRGRVHRLMTIFAQNPQVLGIGLDEDTAVELQPGTGFRVLGSGAVMVFDGRVTHSNAADVGDEAILAATDSVLHVLPAGYGFDLQAMRPRLPSGELIPEKPHG